MERPKHQEEEAASITQSTISRHRTDSASQRSDPNHGRQPPRSKVKTQSRHESGQGPKRRTSSRSNKHSNRKPLKEIKSVFEKQVEKEHFQQNTAPEQAAEKREKYHLEIQRRRTEEPCSSSRSFRSGCARLRAAEYLEPLF